MIRDGEPLDEPEHLPRVSLASPPGEQPMSDRRFAVIGVGTGGSSAVDRLLASGLDATMSPVVFIAADIDAEALSTAQAPHHLLLTGDRDARARSSVLRDRLRHLLTDVTSLIIVAGLGGATGTRSCVQLARLADSLGVETIGVVTTPFFFEGKRRREHAESGLRSLTDAVDALFTLPNQELFTRLGARSTLEQAFGLADESMAREVSRVVHNLSAP